MRISQALNASASQAIPNDVDLRHRVHERLQRRSRGGLQPWSSFGSLGFKGVGVAASVLIVLVAAAGVFLWPPQLSAAERLEQQAREAAQDVESYRYTVYAALTFADEMLAGNDKQLRGAGEWTAAGDFRLEADASAFLSLGGPDRPFEYVWVHGRLFERELHADGRWQEHDLQRRMVTGAPPQSLLVGTAEWELVAPEEADEEASVYHLRGTRTQESQPILGPEGRDTGEAFQASFVHDLFLSAETMLPIRRDSQVVNQRVGAGGETIAEWTQTWSWEFSDYNAPISINLPEPREELPNPDATPPPPSTPTPRSE
ncbi:MAG: hypothetical protein WD533_06650 [Dehalococcoidia bacterium]